MMAAGLIFSIAGCGNGNLATVEGNVTVGGKPADDGTITFNPADGQGPSAGTAIKNGKYQFTGSKGLPPGAKNVEITVTLKTGRQVPSGAFGAPAGTMLDETKSFSSKETCNITAGQINCVDFDLKPMHAKK
jgi:hypothetical protein